MNSDLKTYFSNTTDVFIVAGPTPAGLSLTLGVIAGTPTGFQGREWTTFRAIGPGGSREITCLVTVRPDIAAGAFGTPYATSYVGQTFTDAQPLAGASDVIVRNCTLQGQLQLQSCTNVLIIDCTFELETSDQQDGLRFSQNGTGCRNVLAMHNTIRWAGKDGINVSGNAGHNSNIHLLNNQIEGCGDALGAGLGFEHGLYPWGGVTFQGNVVLDCAAGNGATPRGGGRIRNNFFDSTLEAGVAYFSDHPADQASGLKLLIEGNVFARTAEAGVKLRTPPSDPVEYLTYPVAEIEIRNNVFGGASGDPDVVVNTGYAKTLDPLALLTGWNHGTYPIAISRAAGGVWTTDFDADDHVPDSLFETTLYVDYATGSSGNNGLSPATPKGAIHQAFTAGNATGAPYAIEVAPGVIPRTDSLHSSATVFPTQSFRLRVSGGGRVVTGTFDALSWPGSKDATYANCTKVARSSVATVWRTDVLTAGDYTKLARVADATTCNSTPNSYAQVGSDLYVNLSGGAVASNANTRVYLRSVGSPLQLSAAFAGKKALIEGFDFEGGSSTGAIYIPAGVTDAVVVMRNCSGKYAGDESNATASDGCTIHGTGLYVVEDCLFASCTKDGFNSSWTTDAVRRTFLLTKGLRTRALGLMASSSSNNGYTLHGSVVGIDIDGVYEGSRGGAVRNIDSSQALMLGAKAGPDAAGGGINPVAYRTDGTAALFLLDSEAVPSAVGAESINNTGTGLSQRRNVLLNGGVVAGTTSLLRVEYTGVDIIGGGGVGENGNTRASEAAALAKFPPFSRGVRPGTPEPEPAVPPVAHTVTGGSATSGSGTFTDYETGDLLIACVGASSTIDITVPAGWTPVAAERDEVSMTSGVFWRIAASDGADTLGDWGSGRPRYMRVRDVNPTTPIRQHAFQSSASGSANIVNPALPAAPSGNSLVLTFAGIRVNTEGVAPSLRADCSSLYTRTTSGGFHVTVGVSTTIPVVGWAAQTTGLTGGAANTNGAHSWVIEIDGIPGDEAPAAAADATVSTLSALQSALAAVPSGLGRDYVIAVQPGNYGYLSFGSAYARGTTRVCLRADRSAGEAVFTGIDMRNSNRVELAHLTIRGSTLDQWGFPAGSASSSRGVHMSGAANAHLHGLLIEDVVFGIEANNVTDSEIGYCTVRSFAVDGIRLFRNSGPHIHDVHLHHTVVDVNAPTEKWPDLSTMGLHYDLSPSCAIDPRRSDQNGYWRNASSSVQTPGGSSVTVTAAAKDGRHPDCIQLAGYSENVVIEDCDLRTNDVYCHGIYLNNADDGDGVSVVTGLAYRRNRITSAHVHAMAFIGVDETTVVDQCLIRQWPGSSWGIDVADGTADQADLMRAGISTRENTMADITVTNTVVPATTSSYWMHDDKIAATDLVRSDTAVPTGWETTDVALGLVGHLYAPAIPSA